MVLLDFLTLFESKGIHVNFIFYCSGCSIRFIIITYVIFIIMILTCRDFLKSHRGSTTLVSLIGTVDFNVVVCFEGGYE